MTDDKCREVIDIYENKAKAIIDVAKDLGMDSHEYTHYAAADHIINMIPRARELLAAGRREKLMRWIGFMQGAWFVANVYSLEDLKRHNMPPGEEFNPNA